MISLASKIIWGDVQLTCHHPAYRFPTDIVAIFDDALNKTAEEVTERLGDEYVSKPLRDYFQQKRKMANVRLQNLRNVKRFGNPTEEGGTSLEES